MGALVSLIKPSSRDESVLDIVVDLEKAQPLPEEAVIHRQLSEFLSLSNGYVDSLKKYSGCGDFIRKAISEPSQQTEKEAWDALFPAVQMLREYYEYSLKLQDIFPRIMQFFLQGELIENLSKYQATVKVMCDILHFVSVFDELKMCNPNVQNDFSYYRRSLVRMRGQVKTPVDDELANRMSLFYAYAAPMTKSLIDSLQQLKSSNLSQLLSLIAAVCYNAVDKVQQARMTQFCLRVLVLSIILYDNVNPEGAFSKNSEISIKMSVKVIKMYGGENETNFMNALRYSTIHLNDESTPKAIKQLIISDNN